MNENNQDSDLQNAANSIGVGAAVGCMGLAVGGTAVAVTMAPMSAAGAVLGVAGYGLYKLFGGK